MDLECALSDGLETKHILNEPLKLSCSHSVCKDCVIETALVKCRVCGKLNQNDLLNAEVSNEIKMKISMSLGTILAGLEEKMAKTLADFKGCVSNAKEKIENIDLKIEYFKDQIDLRVESLRIQLDTLQEKLKSELDDLKVDMLKNIERDIEVDTQLVDYERQLDELRKSQQRTEETLYTNQNSLLKMKASIDKIANWDLKLEFQACDDSITEQMIGYLIYNKKYKQIDRAEIAKRLKKSKFEEKIANIFPIDVCQLPNGYLVSCNSDSFTLYNDKYELVKKVSPVAAWNLTHNNENTVYYTDEKNNQLIMCDLNFKQKKSTGSKGSGKEEFRDPHGVCYSKSNNRVYVCDSGNKRIKVYSAELDCLVTHLLDMRPFQIEIVDNTACVRSFSTFDTPLCFYNLKNFTLKYSHVDKHGPVSVINTNFYQFDVKNERLFCYNTDGVLIDDTIEAKGIDNVYKSTYDCILVQFNGDLAVSSQQQGKLFII